MSAFMTLSSDRICLRRWRAEDREAFAAMNSDARVMEFFRSRLSRVESDAMVDRIQEHFAKRDFGLWAIELPDVAPFIGFAGLAVPRFIAHFTPCVEIGWRLAFEQDPEKGLALYFTPLKGAVDTHTLPIGVRWNPDTKRYQSLDRSYEHFLNEAPSLNTARSNLR